MGCRHDQPLPSPQLAAQWGADIGPPSAVLTPEGAPEVQGFVETNKLVELSQTWLVGVCCGG